MLSSDRRVRHGSRESAFTLLELATVILILAVLVGVIAVPVFVDLTGKADSSVAQYNIKAGEEIQNQLWCELVERNNFPNGLESYRDANPPPEVGSVGAGGYVVVDARYFSCLEKKIQWVDMTASGSLEVRTGMFAGLSPDVDVIAEVDESFMFNMAGLYRNGELVKGTENWGNDVGKMPGKIAVLTDTVFLDYTWYTNPENKYLSMLVMERSGKTYILTFHQGALVYTYDLQYEKDSGDFSPMTWPADLGNSIIFTPKTLNLDSKGSFTCSFYVDTETWKGLDETSFDISSVVCGNAHATEIKVNDKGKVTIKFDRQDLVGVEPGKSVPVIITGKYTNGDSFSGTTNVKVVVNTGKTK